MLARRIPDTFTVPDTRLERYGIAKGEYVTLRKSRRCGVSLDVYQLGRYITSLQFDDDHEAEEEGWSE